MFSDLALPMLVAALYQFKFCMESFPAGYQQTLPDVLLGLYQGVYVQESAGKAFFFLLAGKHLACRLLQRKLQGLIQMLAALTARQRAGFVFSLPKGYIFYVTK